VRAVRSSAGIVPAAVCTAALILLAACAGLDTESTGRLDTGKWQFERNNNPISGRPVTTAWLQISRYNFLSGETYAGQLQLMCFRSRPVVRLSFTEKVGTDRTAALAYRFDERPGHEVDATFFAREGMIVIDRPDEVARFVGELQTAQILSLRVTQLRGGNFNAKFSVHGAPHAIEAAYAECPVADRPKIRTSAHLRHAWSWLSGMQFDGARHAKGRMKRSFELARAS